MRPILKKGDIFFVENHTILGWLINWAQRLLSSDGKARYNHSGIIMSDDGQTLESLWKVESHAFFERYNGKQVLIARMQVPQVKINAAVDSVNKEDSGKKYHVHRFLYLIVPPLAKYINVGESVCSELSAKVAYYAGVRHNYYQGTTPDKLVDEVRHWKEYAIPFEGMVE